jgi:two-component system NtrC family sensor kinase
MANDLGAARREVTEWSQKLEEKVVEKTNELGQTQRQVLHMEKMSSLGKLSATVAHELNNPISGMLTYTRLVRRELGDQPIDEEARGEMTRYLSLVEKECSRCGSIVQNLLLFARKAGTEMAVTDLNDVVGRSIMIVQHHLQMASIDLETKLLDGDPTVVVDASQIQQALVALFVNAVEAMSDTRQDGGILSISLEGDAEEVRIAIADTGVGIPPEVLPQIFEPFFSSKHKESGVGLGLAVVYGIVERHSGRIDVESKVNQGTTFRIRLPRKPNVTEGSTPSDPTDSQPTEQLA